jgi:hypothetical protein
MTSKEKIKHRKSREWAETRIMTLERDNYTCQCCGNKLPKAKLQVHHMDESIYGREREHIELLKTLCSACHEMIERWIKKICKGKYASPYTLVMWSIISNFTVEQIPQQKLFYIEQNEKLKNLKNLKKLKETNEYHNQENHSLLPTVQ